VIKTGIVNLEKCVKILICDENGSGQIITLDSLRKTVDDLINIDEFREMYKDNILNKEWYFWVD